MQATPAAPAAPAAPPPTPRLSAVKSVGKYTLGRTLGEGTFAKARLASVREC